MLKIFRTVYTPLRSRGASPHSDEEHRSFIDDKHHDENTASNTIPPGSNRIRLSLLFSWIIAVANLGLFLNQYLRHPNEFECARLLSSYCITSLISPLAPAMQTAAIEYYDTNFQNEFGGRSEYVGPPTPELEERWDALWSRGTIEVPLDGPEKLNKSTEGLKHALKDPKRGYEAVLEVFHHLHCLNQIRQYTWKEYYATHMAEWIAQDNHGIVDLNVTDHRNVGDRMHVDHCIEALRLQIMCSADVTPLLVEVDESSSLGQKADFNVHHRCRSWEKVTEWQSAHMNERRDVRRSTGV
ncbi:hypothetical protein GGR50DRAFT_703419 [Xylaria sp. CBS 124048]|nr:hypothetical protein GGR50DRAFT_703419 [Xylaria sp. CBS 124048]